VSRRSLLALALTLGLLTGGCRYFDNKYWSFPVSAAVYHAAWRHDHPDTNGLLRSLLFLLCDLPIFPITFPHDVYAFFALDDEGTLPDDVPHPGRTAPPPPPPPAVVIRPVEADRPLADPAWSSSAFEVEATE
jgi:hypothetical protein